MKHILRGLVLAVFGVSVSSCNDSAQSLPPMSVLLFNFAPGFAGVALNAPLVVVFSAPLDPNTVTPDSVRIFTTTTTTENPDPGAPAVGERVVVGNVLRFLPRLPELADLSDAGLRIGFTYTIQVPASPDVIEPVRTIEGDPNLVPFAEFFTTLNSTILPAPGDITAEPNLPRLNLFFVDVDRGDSPIGGLAGLPCDRDDLPVADRDSPQVIDTDPDEGESGFGTITGIQQGLGTAFVRLDPITLEFSEAVGPWRIRPENIAIRNTNLGGEQFDLFFFFTQDRDLVRLQMTVFDADSAFDQASVPQGRYVLTLTDFTDLAGNPLVNTNNCVANGTFQLTFSTVSSPTQPADVRLTFQDNDSNTFVDYGGLGTGVNDPNLVSEHVAPFLGGIAVDQPGLAAISPSNQTTSANWGNTAFWTGVEVRYFNGYIDEDTSKPVPNSMRLRGGTSFAATPIMAPIAGRANGPSNPSGSLDGTSASVEPGKVDFDLTGVGTVTLFTGSAATGPIVYHYNSFTLATDGTGRPLLQARPDSIYPLCIFVEDDALISGDINLAGEAGAIGFNGGNAGETAGLSVNPGGIGGNGVAGGGDGGNGGAAIFGADPTLLNGGNGGVPVNVLAPLDELGEAIAGLTGMATGGGGHYVAALFPQPAGDPEPVYSGGGGGGVGGDASGGGDADGQVPGETDHGRGGIQFGDTALPVFTDPLVLGAGGAGGGGGGAEDDGAGGGGTPNAEADQADDGGGGGGAGGGFVSICCNGDITIGVIDIMDPGDPDDDVITFANIRCNGGRGGSTYATVAGDPPVGADAGGLVDETGPIGEGEAGGGGAGGGIALVARGQITFNAAEMYVHGKQGGNSPQFEAGTRVGADKGGDGAGGGLFFCDSDGIDTGVELGAPFGGNNNLIQIIPDPTRDLDGDGAADLDPVADAAEIRNLNEMTGNPRIEITMYGDDPRERLFTTSQIVTEFFDTLSDTVSYDEVRVLSNAPRFPYDVADSTLRTIRVWVDVARTGPGGLPDLSSETGTGQLVQPEGASEEIGLHFNGVPPQAAGDPVIGEDVGAPQFESRSLVATSSPLNSGFQGAPGDPPVRRRFVRVRIIFNLALIGTPAELLGDLPASGDPADIDSSLIFAAGNAANLTIADDPATPTLENTLGNIDAARAGVPAVAELRVRFVP